MSAVEFNAGIRDASRADAAKFLLAHNLPTYLQGLFTRSRFWTSVCSWLQRDPQAVRFLDRMYRKYRARGLRVGRSTVLLFDLGAVGEVLRHSPERFADPPAKRNGMSRFQPQAATISRGAAWRMRREFNVRVLALGQLHPLAGDFYRVICEEVERLTSRRASRIGWSDLERLFRRISTGVIFGAAARRDTYLMRTLTRLMRNGNRAALRRPLAGELENFTQAVEGYLRHPEPGSLAGLCGETLQDRSLAVPRQLTHWMFAMNETLAINSARALALLASRDGSEDVLAEAREFPAATPPPDRELPSPPLLQGALQEAMRLWPTTPYLARRLLRQETLCGEPLAAGTQLLIVNAWFHRSQLIVEDGNRFRPERWAGDGADPRFNHLSSGTQGCAGRDLALLLGTEVLLQLLARTQWRLARPALDPRRELPHRLNHFALVFSCSPQRGQHV